MNKNVAEMFIGKNVNIFPGDTYFKQGTVIDVDDNGVALKITKAHPKAQEYVPGKLYYIPLNRIFMSEI